MKLLQTSNNIAYNSYVPISKILLYEEEYRELSSGAKILYEYITDRWNLSKKNNFCNKSNEVYVLFKQEELCRLMNVSLGTMKKYFNELKKYELIYIEKQALGKPNKIYLTNKINNAQGQNLLSTESKNDYGRHQNLLSNNNKYNKNYMSNSVYDKFSDKDWNSLYCN